MGSFVYLAFAHDLRTLLVIGQVSWREIDILSSDAPSIGLELRKDDALQRAVAMFLSASNAELVLVVTRVPLFAFEPVLKRLQTMGTVPMPEELDDQRDFEPQRADFADAFAAIASQYYFNSSAFFTAC